MKQFNKYQMNIRHMGYIHKYNILWKPDENQFLLGTYITVQFYMEADKKYVPQL